MQGQMPKGMKRVIFPLSETRRRVEALIDHVQRLLGQIRRSTSACDFEPARQTTCMRLYTPVILESTCQPIIHNMTMPSLHVKF